MTKERLRLLGVSLCLSISLLSWASPQLEAQTATKRTRPAVAQTANAGAESTHSTLLAERVKTKNRLQEEKKKMDAQIAAQVRRESLQDPAGDLYGEDAWTDHVNPFAGRSVDIPDTHSFDLGEFVMPIDRKYVTSGFGYRSRFGRMHYGTDLALSTGDTVRAAFSGKVRLNSYDRGGYGNYVVIRHPNGLETVYGHLSRGLVREGTVVKAGDPIALGGSTGRSTGPHLHFETRFLGLPINPELMFDFWEGVPRQDRYTFVKREHGAGLSYMARHSSCYAHPKSSSVAEIKTYRIRKGDTYAKIAQAHGTTVSKLMALNSHAKLRPGKSLRLP